MKEARFTVPGEPKGKQRPRVTRNHKTGRSVTYTPDQTVMYENLVRISYMEQCGNVKFDGAVWACITAYFPIPKSASKRKKDQMQRGEIQCTKKPDCDNIAKSILDSLNNIAYGDDAQVVFISVVKSYDENPRVEVTLSEG